MPLSAPGARRPLSSGVWRWVVWGLAAIGVGLVLWWTTFVLMPLGAILIVVGFVRWVRFGGPRDGVR